jgi:hypothetical protein
MPLCVLALGWCSPTLTGWFWSGQWNSSKPEAKGAWESTWVFSCPPGFSALIVSMCPGYLAGRIQEPMEKNQGIPHQPQSHHTEIILPT